jgi:ATP-binding cassette, subfamily G (WHITE), member 2
MSESTEDIALSFRNIGIASTHILKQTLSNVSGYVVRGGMTAILGPSGSGKSLLLRTLSGRVHDLQVSGDFFVGGEKVDHRDITNGISYVPQESFLIGDLSARETLFNSAAMKRNKTIEKISEDVFVLLASLDLSEVADSPVGTLFVRGLSEGQKKLVDIGTELIAAPPILFLDEPTSGLDAFIAYDVIKCIRDIARASDGKLSVMLSIKSPNSRLLELFDHILVLGNGTMNFFGTVTESVEHLSSMGYPPPRNYTPTDYFLQVSDRYFEGRGNVNFAGTMIETTVVDGGDVF